MTKIYLDAEDYTEVTRERDDEDQWSGEDTATTWAFGRVTVDPKKYGGGHSFPATFDIVPGDTVYIVVAVWSTGDSFSSDRGRYSEIFGVFKDASEAMEYEKFLDSTQDNRYDYNLKNKSINYPWYGYFEGLDYVQTLVRKVDA